MPANPAANRWLPEQPPTLSCAPRIHAFALPRERAAAKLHAGQPLLHDEPVLLDTQFATGLFVRLARGHRLDVGQLDLTALFTEAFVQHADHVRQIAAVTGPNAELIADLAEQAVRPLREAYAARLAPLVESSGWERGYCPICGGQPGAGDEPILRCAACGCTWQADRASTGFRLELALPEDEAW
jgi:hypothetical protein